MAAAGQRAGNEAGLPFAALQLLAPPVRLVSAALWKALQQRDVTRYGVVEEFVTSACETVPGLLTPRHQAKLALGLRARLVLELCSKQPDENVIRTHLGRIRAPAVQSSSSSSAPTVRRDLKIERTVESFHLLVQTLLADPAEREQFFEEEFPVDYGPMFDQELEKLLWEFLLRVDQLLPVPNLAQTVSWLSDTPSVVEHCARAATQPQLLNILLQHQTCLGHLETAASLPPSMGDSILTSLSLPPSGRAPQNQAAAAAAAEKHAAGASGGKTPFITPVIGIMSNEDIPVMVAASEKRESLKFTAVKQRQSSEDNAASKGRGGMGAERNASKRTSGMKRKQRDGSESDDDEEEEEEEEEEALGMSRSGTKRVSKRLRKGAIARSRAAGERMNGSDHGAAKRKDRGRAVLQTCVGTVVENPRGVRPLWLPDDPYLSSIFLSCLDNQPRVVLEKRSVTPATTSGGGGDGGAARSSRAEVKADSDDPGLEEKENRPAIPTASGRPSQQRGDTGTLLRPGHGDYVTDSEDEATKNFNGRLFTQRYYRTKHGTYVPTLREYWKPWGTRRGLSSAAGKRR